MALVLVMYETNRYWPGKAPQLTTSVLDAVCCHCATSGPYFIFALLLSFDEHVKCNESDQEMTELMSKPSQGINTNNKTDDILVMQWMETLSPVLRMVYLACNSKFCRYFS